MSPIETMPLPADSNDSEDADASNATAGEPTANGALEDTFDVEAAQDPDSTIHIELNFNAFADHVPPNQHARRTPSYTDPSVQDFADQALELAALRAELNRLTRDYDGVVHTLRLRDARLRRLQDELALARSELRDLTRQSAAHSRRTLLTEVATQSGDGAVERVAASPRRATPQPNEDLLAGDLSATLDLAPPQVEIPATLADAPRTAQQSKGLLEDERRLIPVDHDGAVVILRRDVLTIGRTRVNDICIPSRAVSRDHARLLMSPRSVTIVDMNSANGCFVNDEPVKRQKLRNGDVLRIGDRSYRFSSEANRPQRH